MIVEGPFSIVTALLLDDGTVDWSQSDSRTAELLVDPRVRLGALLFYGRRNDAEFIHARDPVFVLDGEAYYTTMIPTIMPSMSNYDTMRMQRTYNRQKDFTLKIDWQRTADLDLGVKKRAQQVIDLWLEKML